MNNKRAAVGCRAPATLVGGVVLSSLLLAGAASAGTGGLAADVPVPVTAAVPAQGSSAAGGLLDGLAGGTGLGDLADLGGLAGQAGDLNGQTGSLAGQTGALGAL